MESIEVNIADCKLNLVVGELNNLNHWRFINSKVTATDKDIRDAVYEKIDHNEYIVVTNLHALKGYIVIISKKQPNIKIGDSLAPFGLLVGKGGSNLKNIEKDTGLNRITVSE